MHNPDCVICDKEIKEVWINIQWVDGSFPTVCSTCYNKMNDDEEVW